MMTDLLQPEKVTLDIHVKPYINFNKKSKFPRKFLNKIVKLFKETFLCVYCIRDRATLKITASQELE